MSIQSNIRNLPVLNRAPSKTDGTDGSTYLVRDRGSVYIYHKNNNEWYRIKMEKV